MPSRKGLLSGRLTGGRPGSRQSIATAAGLLFIVIVSSWGVASGGHSTAPLVAATSGAGAPPPGTVASITDGQSIYLVVGAVNYTLSDTITAGSVSATSRSYDIALSANLPLVGDLVALSTSPVTQWADPHQMPGGPDNLPALSSWSWTITKGGKNDTANWTEESTAGLLLRSVAWGNTTFVVTGSPALSIPISFTPGKATGPSATQPGFVMSTMLPTTDPGFTSLAKSVAPGLIRWEQSFEAPATWHNSSGTVSFDFQQFDQDLNFTAEVGAKVYLTLPAGTWGDGNTLPSGMPLNTSLLVDYWGHSTGYFPTLAAYKTYVTTFAKDVKSNDWSIAYWNIGNEVPVGYNKTQAAAFVGLFNAAEAAIHAVLPDALVGSDVFTWPTKEGYFASATKGVGFLAFHDYPATGLCDPSSTFCPPDNVKGYLTDSEILANSANFSDLPWSSSPLASQEAWYNDTGNWVPVIDAESNLNSAQANGIDARTPTLFNGAWLVSQLIDGSGQNVSSLLVYSFDDTWPPAASPTEQYGGWGDGMIAMESSGTNLEFAPYWALDLWATAVPLGAKELPLTDANSSVVRAFATGSSSSASVIVANLDDTAVTIPITSSSSTWIATSATTLDSTTYKMVYDSSTKSVKLSASGLGHPTPSDKRSMSITLEGYGVAVVTFTPVPPGEYSVSFTESGLASGTNWSVKLNDVVHSSTGPKITFTEANGSYAYAVTAVAGYTVSPASGTLTVKGATNQDVTFKAKTTDYAVGFTEAGLASATNWSVTFDGKTVASTGSTVSFSVPNGTYDYSVAVVPGYSSSSSSGSVDVAGEAVNKSVKFTLLAPDEFVVAFSETGLPAGTNWNVTLAGAVASSTGSEVQFTKENGTYSYTVGSVDGYDLSSVSGTVKVAGGGQTVPVSYVVIPATLYPITFAETGLPSGTNWSVTVGTTFLATTAASLVLDEANGSYGYEVGSVSGYSTAAGTGSFEVSGASASFVLAFASTGGSNLGSPAQSGASGHVPNPGGAGELLDLLSLGFLRPTLGDAALVAIRTGFAIVLVLCLGVLLVRWPRPEAIRARRAANAQVLRLHARLGDDCRPPGF